LPAFRRAGGRRYGRQCRAGRRDGGWFCSARLERWHPVGDWPRNAARQATLVELRVAIAGMKVAVGQDDPIAYGQHDSAFHQDLFCHTRFADAYGLVSSRIAALRPHPTAICGRPAPRKVMEQSFDQIACVHMSGLSVRSHMNAGQDGFRDRSSKHLSDLQRPLALSGCLASWIDRSRHLLISLQVLASAQCGCSIGAPRVWLISILRPPAW
jgi:hypothetical protein